MVENVAPRRVRPFPVITIPDTVYARTQDLMAVGNAFGETFEEFAGKEGCRIGGRTGRFIP
jgi:hypothetical protein